jgi:hypothetical protein
MNPCLDTRLVSPAIPIDVFRVFGESLHDKDGIMSRLGSDGFLPDSFKFSIHHSPYYSMIHYTWGTIQVMKFLIIHEVIVYKVYAI